MSDFRTTITFEDQGTTALQVETLPSQSQQSELHISNGFEVRGNAPQWELAGRVFPDAPAQYTEGHMESKLTRNQEHRGREHRYEPIVGRRMTPRTPSHQPVDRVKSPSAAVEWSSKETLKTVEA